MLQTADEPFNLSRKSSLNSIFFFLVFFSFRRTFVNIVPVPFVKSVVMVNGKPTHCQILHHGECACWIGHLYNQSKKGQDRYHRIQQEVHRAEASVAAMKEFRNLKEFAVVFQPWPEGLSVK